MSRFGRAAVVLGVVAMIGAGTPSAPSALPAPPKGTVVAGAPKMILPATFVHMVGRFAMIEEWIEDDLEAALLEIIPIHHGGNPAFRVIYIAKGDEEPTTVVILAGGGFELGDIIPVEE